MHILDQSVFSAWAKVKERLLRDPDELRARLARRRLGILTKPPRATCLAIRAADRRMTPMNTAMNPYRNADTANPGKHEVVSDKPLVQMLCAPVDLRDWRGQDARAFEKAMGIAPSGLCYQMRKGIVKVDRIFGLDGKHCWVPLAWTDQLLDPGSGSAFRPPDAAWGSSWRFKADALSDDFQQTLARVPWMHERARTANQFRGWRWVCPGCGRTPRVLFCPTRQLTLSEYCGDEEVLLKAAGSDPDGPDALPKVNETFACGKCHRVRNYSAIDRHSWNELIAYFSGGLMYGPEVTPPTELVRKRQRKFVKHLADHPREEEVERLLIAGLKYEEVAREMGVTINTIQGHVRRLYKRRGVHRRRELAERMK